MVTGIRMLARSEMFKPEPTTLNMRAAFTDGQELKQAHFLATHNQKHQVVSLETSFFQKKH